MIHLNSHDIRIYCYHITRNSHIGDNVSHRFGVVQTDTLNAMVNADILVVFDLNSVNYEFCLNFQSYLLCFEILKVKLTLKIY